MAKTLPNLVPTMHDIPSWCAGAEKLAKKYASSRGKISGSDQYENIISACSEFMECVRYLNTRRTDATVLKLDSEAAVQDALYLMLRPWVRDLIPENPTDRIANRYTVKDFLTETSKCAIEAKYVRDRNHGKNITKELNDDIDNYRHHAKVERIIFFIYDPETLIPDNEALRKHIEINRTYGQRRLECRLIVKP